MIRSRRPLRKVLIANRAEFGSRVIRDLRSVLRHPSLLNGETDSGFIEAHGPELLDG